MADEKKDKKKWKVGIWPALIGSLVILTVLILLIPEQKKVKEPDPNKNNAPTSNQPVDNTAEKQLRAQLPEPEVGTVHVTTSAHNAFRVRVPRGWHILFVPVDSRDLTEAVEHYIDGKKVSWNATFSGEHDESWRLVENNRFGVLEKDFAVVVYMGPDPALHTWYPLALQAGPLEQRTRG